MIIRVRREVSEGVAILTYYHHMKDGVAVLRPSRKGAASFNEAQAAKVLEQLRVIDNRFADAVLVNG